MARLFTDTHPDAEAVMLRLYRETPAWRKLQLLSELNALGQALSMQGLRERHPDASRRELDRLFAQMTLGKDLAELLYQVAPQRIGEIQLKEIVAVLKRFI